MNISLSTTPASAERYDALDAVINEIITNTQDGQYVFRANPKLRGDLLARITTASIDQILAGVVATYPEDDATVWLVSLAVRQPFRARGLATSLVYRAVQDSLLFYGASATLRAWVRIRNDGHLNYGSARALEANGFSDTAQEIRFKAASGGSRAAHLTTLAEPGGWVTSRLFARHPHRLAEGA